MLVTTQPSMLGNRYKKQGLGQNFCLYMACNANNDWGRDRAVNNNTTKYSQTSHNHRGNCCRAPKKETLPRPWGPWSWERCGEGWWRGVSVQHKIEFISCPIE